MFKLCVLLAFAAPTLALKISCSDLPTAPRVDLSQLVGQWVVEEWTKFVYGPAAPASSQEVNCITGEVDDVTENGLILNLTFVNQDKVTSTRSSRLERVGDLQGRFDILSDHPKLQNHQLLVLEVDASKQMALLFCRPEKGQDDVTKRAAHYLNLLSRRQGRMSAEELTEVRTKVALTLGVEDLGLKKLNPDC